MASGASVGCVCVLFFFLIPQWPLTFLRPELVMGVLRGSMTASVRTYNIEIWVELEEYL